MSIRLVSLSTLLPYDPATKKNKDLRAGLKEYQMLLAATDAAIAALEGGSLEEFDAVVGENACQIRAVKIAMTASKCLSEAQSLSDQVAAARLQMEVLSQSMDSLMKSGVSLKVLLEKENGDVALSPDMSFFFQSFLLSTAKTVKPPDPSDPLCRNDAADPKKLKRFGDVSASFSDNLVKRLRQLLSAASVQFVQEQAKSLGDKNLERMCSQEFVVNYKGCWPCTPMFWSYKTLLLAAKEERVPLVVEARFLAKDRDYAVVDEQCLFFPPPGVRDLTKPAVYIQGAVCANADLLPSAKTWKTAILARTILDVILAGAADHRQYPDVGEDRRIEVLEDEEYQGYKTLAAREGYARANPGMFFIQHVYPAPVSRAFFPGWPQWAVTQITAYLGNQGDL